MMAPGQEHELATIERHATFALDLEQTWEALYGDDLQNWVRLSDSVVEVRDFQLRDDGTPAYVMVNRSGPMKVSHRSDYDVWQPPHRAEDVTSDSALGGRFVATHEAVPGGTRVTHTWAVEPRGMMRLLFPLVRRGMQKAFQRDLDDMAARSAALGAR